MTPAVLLLMLAACGGGGETPGSAGTGGVANKAVADVDAAMADAQRSRIAPPGQPMPAQAPTSAPARQ